MHRQISDLGEELLRQRYELFSIWVERCHLGLFDFGIAEVDGK